jgi:hypothetical protein
VTRDDRFPNAVLLYLFFAFLIAAHRLRCAAAMRALPAADIVRRFFGGAAAAAAAG